MHTPRLTWLAVPLTMLSCLPSCGIFGESTARAENVDTLVSWVERVYVESEMARQEVQLTLSRLQALASGKFEGRPTEAYQAFKAAATRARTQAEKLEATVRPMKRTAIPVFEQWTDDLGDFHSSSMRRRSADRLDAARARYDAIIRAVGPAQSNYERFNAGMKDHELFLGHDLNATAIASVKDDVRAMVVLAQELDSHFARCLATTKEYIDATAQPVASAPPSRSK